MKLYSIHSKSHNILYENYFLSSLPKDIKLISETMPQVCESGSFRSNGWNSACFLKTSMFLRGCEENKNDYFIFSDVDVQFFTPTIVNILLEELGDYDIACQNDTRKIYCSGFFICKVNDRTTNLFHRIHNNYTQDDQSVLNKYIHKCKATYLSDRFFTVAHQINTVWRGQNFHIPTNILVHHANWTVGINNKINLLNIVKEKYNRLLISSKLDSLFISSLIK